MKSPSPNEPVTSTPIVALGASAGGLEALQQFFASVGADLPAAFVVLQHLSPAHQSRMGDLLSRHTALRVVPASDGVRVEPGTVYLIPSAHNLELEAGRLHWRPRSPAPAVNLPIDQFFASLAAHPGSPCAAIVLSGTGSDGSRGIQAVATAGGYALVQEPGSATFDGMPRAAIAAGCIDFVGSPSELSERVRMLLGAAGDSALPAPEDDPYEDVMKLLRQNTSVDFSQYKRGTVLRRLQRRVVRASVRDLGEYAEHLRNEPGELRALYQDLLISVTAFFRDPGAFELLRDRALRPAMQAAGAEGVRIWIPGCATGEEAYTVAMLTAEIEAELDRPVPVKIFATDIDAQALADAGAGVYGTDAVASLDEARLERFFEQRHGGLYSVRREIRQRILFTRHDVCSDPPFTRVDVISCRNLLIYFGPDLQHDVFAVFHFALKPNGKLLLGPSEAIRPELEASFERVVPASGLYEKVGGPIPTRRTIGASPSERSGTTIARKPPAKAPNDHPLLDAAQRLASEFSPRSLVVDERCSLRHVFGSFDDLLKLPAGAADGSLLRMVPSGLSTLLSAAVPRALRANKEGVYIGLDVPGIAETSVHVVPLPERPDEPRLALLVFRTTGLALPDVESSGEQIRFDAARQAELDELQRELQRSKESLQTLVEELETSNEELQATNEELLAANEELHSINDELHSANALNEVKIQELLQLNNDMNNLLSGTDVGTLFLDAELRVRKFTPAVGRFMHLLDSDVGRPVADLRVPAGSAFLASADRVLHGGPAEEHDFTGPQGEQSLVRVLPYRTAGTSLPTGVIATFVDVTRLREALAETQAVLDSLPVQVATLEPSGRIRMVNAAWRRFSVQNGCLNPATTSPGADYLGVCLTGHGDGDGDDDDDDGGTMSAAHAGLSDVLAGRRNLFTLEYPCHSPDEERWFLMHATPLPDSRGAVVAHIDVTARVQSERRANGGAQN